MLKKIQIKTDFIKLGQLIKFIGLIDNGAQAKEFLTQNLVFVNNEIEQRRGRKIIKGDEIKIKNDVYVII